MTKIIDNDKVSQEVLEQMKRIGGGWVAYRNVSLGDKAIGHLKFLRCGPGCYYERPPVRYPEHGLHPDGAYIHVGTVDLNTGEIREECGKSKKGGKGQ